MGSKNIPHVTQYSVSKELTPDTDYAGATATDGADHVVDVRCMYNKAFLIQNTGATTISYKILASMDEGANYDVTDTSEATLTAGAQIVKTSTGNYTHMKLQVKSAGATSVTSKVVTSTN